MHRKLVLGVVSMAATMAIAATPAWADTTVAVPLSFNHVVLDTPATGDAQFVTPSTAPLSVTAEVDTTTGAFTIAPSAFSAPTYTFSSPIPGSATLSLAGTATGTINFTTGAVTLTGVFDTTLTLGADGSCVVSAGSTTLTTAATKPLLGSAFPAGATGVATGDGALGASWSTLPQSTDGSACSVVNSAVDGPGGIWISRGITVAEASPTKLSLTTPAKTSVVAGKTATVAVTLTNSGGADKTSVKVCLAGKAGLVTSACQTVKAPAAGSKHRLSFRVTAKSTLKAGSYKLTATATGATAKSVTVKVAK